MDVRFVDTTFRDGAQSLSYIPHICGRISA